MRGKTLIWLAAAAVVAAGLALWLSAERAAVTETRSGEKLLPGLLSTINDVTALAVLDAGDDRSVRLERTATGWVVAERGGYPAQVSELRRALLALAEAELVEAKTARPELHAELGVADPEREDATSTRVRLELAGGEPREIIAGDSGFRGETTTYVRRAGENQSWVATGDLALDADPASWLAREVVDLPTAQVRRVRIEHPDGEIVEIVKDARETPNFALVGLPEGRELLAPSTPNSIAGALAGLRLEDVVPEADFDPQGVDPVRATFEGFDGRRVAVRAWRVGDERLVALEPSFQALPVEAGAEEQGGEASGPPGAPGEAGDATADPEAEMRASAERVAGWVYRIPSYKFSNLTKRLDDLLKPPENETGAS